MVFFEISIANILKKTQKPLNSSMLLQGNLKIFATEILKMTLYKISVVNIFK